MSAFRHIIFTGALIGCSLFALGQNSSAGVRWAYGSGIAFRQILTEKNAVEGMLTARWGGAALTGLYQRQNDIGAEGNWFWYYGGGLHLGVHRRSNDRPFENPRFDQKHLNVGIDLIAALGYSFVDFPLQFTFDFKPTFSFSTEEHVPESFGLTGRWRF